MKIRTTGREKGRKGLRQEIGGWSQFKGKQKKGTRNEGKGKHCMRGERGRDKGSGLRE